MTTSELSLILERQLLLQLGDRIKRFRKAQGLGALHLTHKYAFWQVTPDTDFKIYKVLLCMKRLFDW